MSKLLGCFPCSNSKKRVGFMAKYYIERVFMIELLGDLKIFGTFHLSPIGELVRYKEVVC
jgi:hypothetical protein